MKNNTDVYNVMNTANLADHYPTIYDVCYCLYYKGKAPKRLISNLMRLQCEDVRKLNYCPADLLSKVKTFLS